jgi:hypothetical protein
LLRHFSCILQEHPGTRAARRDYWFCRKIFRGARPGWSRSRGLRCERVELLGVSNPTDSPIPPLRLIPRKRLGEAPALPLTERVLAVLPQPQIDRLAEDRL